MATKVVDNFEYLAQKPLDGRSTAADLTALLAMRTYDIYDGILVYVESEQKYYTFDSNNTVDPVTQKWRELKTGGGSGSSKWGEITGDLKKQTDLQEALDAKQNELTAGKNVTIEDDTISVADSLAQLDYDYLADEETLKLFAEEGEGGTSDYTKLINKPQVNSVELDGNKSLEDLGIQGTLTAGTNITIEDNVISATGGGGGTEDYEELENKPKINGVELIGDKTSAELDIFSKVDYEYEEEGGRLLLLADAGPGNELTVEHKTGETLNGKPIYEKYITITNLSGAANTWLTTPIVATTNNISYIISGIGYYSDDGVSDQAYPIVTNIINDRVSIMHHRNATITFRAVLLKYTKTTD